MLLIYIDLVEIDVRELVGEVLKDGRDDPARATPRCPEVEKSDLVAVDLEICFISSLLHQYRGSNISNSASMHLRSGGTARET